MVLGAYAALRVRGGALEIEHGPQSDRQTIRVDVDADPSLIRSSSIAMESS